MNAHVAGWYKLTLILLPRGRVQVILHTETLAGQSIEQLSMSGDWVSSAYGVAEQMRARAGQLENEAACLRQMASEFQEHVRATVELIDRV